MRIQPLQASRAAEAGDVLAASHADYPAFRHLFPDAVRRRRVVRPFMTAAARDAATHARAVVADDDDGMLGVALWMPPGAFPLSVGRKARMTPGLLRVMVAAGRSSLAFARVGATLERDHPSESVWYLQALGVRPRGQRRGVGTQLMTPVLALADETGVACHLHTSDTANVGYYERFGFEVTSPVVEVFPDGPPYVGMTRRPRRS